MFQTQILNKLYFTLNGAYRCIAHLVTCFYSFNKGADADSLQHHYAVTLGSSTVHNVEKFRKKGQLSVIMVI